MDFSVNGASVRVFCHCQAGVLQQMCKHKLGLIKGDTSMLSDPGQSAQLCEIHSWPQFAALRTRTEAYEQALREIEDAKTALSKQEKALKARFAKGLAQGFE